jgi:hypothetical protein
MVALADQKSSFQARLQRIEAGQQYEHADLLGKATHKAFKRRFGDRPRRPKRTLAEKLMIVIAFLSGMSAVLLGRILYFTMAKMQGLPEAFYDLGTRGMILFSLVIAGLMMVFLHLFTRQRFASLMIGCVVMHYGEVAERNIRGRASAEDARALLEEGVPVLPLPLPEGFDGPLH